jgi:ubiquinone/menaquinone biosynthesis C-methylase UbiE
MSEQAENSTAESTTAKEANKTATSSFDANHELYDQVRPGYIPEAVEWLTARLGLHEGSTVLDLACGTGKFTATIAQEGYTIIGVEPSAGMLETFRKKFPDITALQGDSYHIPVEDNSIDAVIIAQAYHWFADHESLKEIHRVLRPGGSLGLAWNYDDVESLPEDNWQRAITHEIWAYDHNVPQYRQGKWQASFENQPYFRTPYNEERFSFVRQYANNPEAVWQYWQSRSYITALPQEEQERLRQRVYDTFKKCLKPEEVVEGDKINGHYGIHIVWTTTTD